MINLVSMQKQEKKHLCRDQSVHSFYVFLKFIDYIGHNGHQKAILKLSLRNCFPVIITVGQM